MSDAPHSVLITWTKGGKASVSTPASSGRVASAQGLYERADINARERLALRALLFRAHDAMSRREPDWISVAEWDQLVVDIAKEVGL